MFKFIKSLFVKETPVINFACANWGVRKYAPIQPAGKFFPEKFKLKLIKACAEHNI